MTEEYVSDKNRIKPQNNNQEMQRQAIYLCIQSDNCKDDERYLEKNGCMEQEMRHF